MSKLPFIDEKGTKYQNQTNYNQPMLKGSESYQILPNISSSTNITTSFIKKENTMVVKSSSSNQSSHPQLPNEWTSQRVNPIQDHDDIQLTKLEWENQIAKHILSLFASSKAIKNIKEGNALLEFVETTKGPKQSISIDQLPTFQSQYPSNNNEIIIEDKNLIETKQKLKKKKKLKKIKTKQNSDESNINTNNITTDNKRNDKINSSKSFKIVEDIIQRVRNETLNNTSNSSNITKAIDQKQEYKGSNKIIPSVTTTGSSSGQLKENHRVTNTIKTKDGQEVVVRGTPRCFPVWFVSSGDVYSDWTELPGSKKLQAHLNVLYEHKKYEEYLGIVEASIIGVWRKTLYGEETFTIGSFGISSRVPPDAINYMNNNKKNKKLSSEKQQVHSNMKDRQFGDAIEWEYAGEEEGGMVPKLPPSSNTDNMNDSSSYMIQTNQGRKNDDKGGSSNLSEEILLKLWKQLIFTAIAMGILSIEQKQFDEGLSIFKRAETWSSNDDLIHSKAMRKELKAHCKDAIAYYFFRKSKTYSALAYSEEALELYEEVNDMEGVSTCLLHIAAVYSQVGNFKEAHKKLFEFLAMVEGGRLAQADPTPKQLCLVAIGYHNLAVVQLKLNLPDLACKNSQNARKIARLCLSYSNRWINVFQYTHEIAVADIKWELSTKQMKDLSPDQINLIADLAEALFDPDFDAQQEGKDPYSSSSLQG